MTSAVNDEVKGLRKAERRRHLNGGAGVRNVPYGTFELWRLLAGRDEGAFQYPMTRSVTIFGQR